MGRSSGPVVESIPIGVIREHDRIGERGAAVGGKGTAVDDEWRTRFRFGRNPRGGGQRRGPRLLRALQGANEFDVLRGKQRGGGDEQGDERGREVSPHVR